MADQTTLTARRVRRTLRPLAALLPLAALTLPAAAAEAAPQLAVTHGLVVARPATQLPYALPLLHVPAAYAHVPVLEGYDELCTATAVSAYELLTAAHCVTGAGLYYVMVGGNTLTSGRPIAVTALRANPKYNATAITNDVAVLRTLLPMGLPAYAHVGTAPLARAVTSTTPPALRTYGWGRASDASAPDGRLHGLSVTPLRTAALRAYGSGFDPKTQIAAGKPLSGGKVGGTCRGDSGGPLLARANGAPFVVGVTSFGADGSCDIAPGVYTNVGVYASWISSTLRSLRTLPASASRALPVAYGRPSVAGRVAVGHTLVCHSPRFAANARSSSLGWYRNGVRVTSGGRHAVIRGDVGRTLVCKATATSAAGSITVTGGSLRVRG